MVGSDEETEIDNEAGTGLRILKFMMNAIWNMGAHYNWFKLTKDMDGIWKYSNNSILEF